MRRRRVGDAYAEAEKEAHHQSAQHIPSRWIHVRLQSSYSVSILVFLSSSQKARTCTRKHACMCGGTQGDAPFKSEVLRVTFAALPFWPMTTLLSQSTLLMV